MDELRVYSGTGFHNKFPFVLVTRYGKQIIVTHFSTFRRNHMTATATEKYSNILGKLREEFYRQFKDFKEV
jgi:hypothetical protein